MPKLFQRKSIAPWLTLLLAAPLAAQAAGPDAGALQQNLNKQLPVPSAGALPPPKQQAPTTTHIPQAGETTVVVKRFVLKGLTEIPQAQQALRPWLDRPLTLDDLHQACHAVENAYRMQGKLIQATLPPQTVEDGVVTIELTLAHLGKIELEGLTRFNPDRAVQYILHANPAGAPLDSAAIEHALVILNEVPGVAATSALQPGAKPGETDVVLNLQNTPLWSGKAEGNNYGSRSTGVGQGLIALWANDPRGIGDQASINAVDAQGSHYVQSSYSLPLGYAGLRAAASASFLNYDDIGVFATNGGYGHAWTVGTSLSYPWIRAGGHNVNATFGLDYKGYVNDNSASQSVTSDYGIGDLTLGLNANSNDGWGGGGLNNASVTLEFGHVNLNADTPANYGTYFDNNSLSYISYVPDNFAKLSFSAGRTQNLGDERNLLVLNVSGQLASGNLNSAEQFYLGGPYGIRAYPVSQGGGSQGLLASAELQHQLPRGLTGSLFLDAGLVQQYKKPYPGWQGSTNASNVYNLADCGLGLKWVHERWSVNAMVAWALGPNPLYTAAGVPVNVDNTTTNPRGWISASYAF